MHPSAPPSTASSTVSSPPAPRQIRVIDSHTGGEPTRLVIDGFPDPGSGGMAARLERLAREHDRWRAATVLEHDRWRAATVLE
ncbi:proline racemase family protein, partial [Cupriavidus sp. 2MCAB6]|uniref:proline racemase family protein n=1 Tax=Cupriavidus sp. 2MCAB6 TaxID=3232981 RepID=UPI003F92212C